jgi:hypothetical protein
MANNEMDEWVRFLIDATSGWTPARAVGHDLGSGNVSLCGELRARLIAPAQSN